MLAKNLRLTWKDINHIHRKNDSIGLKNFVVLKTFSKNQNQFWINIGLKISKSSVIRHKLKRIFYHSIPKEILFTQNTIKSDSGQKYQKFFFLPSKKLVEKLVELINNDGSFEDYFSHCCKEDINFLAKKIVNDLNKKYNLMSKELN